MRKIANSVSGSLVVVFFLVGLTGISGATNFPPITESMANCDHWCIAKHYDPDQYGRDQFVFVRFNNPQNMWSYEYMHGGDPSGHWVVALTAEGDVNEAWWSYDSNSWGTLGGRIGLIVARGVWEDNIHCNFSSIPYSGNNQANWANGDLPAYSDMDMTALTTLGQAISLSTDPPVVAEPIEFSITSPPLTAGQKANQFYCVQKTQNDTYVFTRFLDTPVSKAYSNFALTIEAASSSNVRQQIWSNVLNSWGPELTWQSVWVAGPNFYDHIACNFDSIIWSDTGGSFNNSMYSDISGPLTDQQYISLPTIQLPPVLVFPLSGYTPYTAPVSSVFDHSATAEYTSDTDHHVTAFNGESSTNTNYYPDTTCYPKSDSSVFGSGFNYQGYGSAAEYYLCYDGHPGFDYQVSSGTDVYSAAAGTVRVAGTNSCLGNNITIEHEGGYSTRYFHLSSIDTSNVPVDQPIQSGIRIGASGNTGTCSDGAHLHFQVEKEGIPVDPYGWTGAGSDPYTRTTNIILWE